MITSCTRQQQTPDRVLLFNCSFKENMTAKILADFSLVLYGSLLCSATFVESGYCKYPGQPRGVGDVSLQDYFMLHGCAFEC